MTSSENAVASALLMGAHKGLAEKTPEETAMEKVIFEAVKRWTGRQVSPIDGFPICRGEEVSYRRNTVLSGFFGGPVHSILSAANIKDSAFLRKRLNALTLCQKAIIAALDEFLKLSQDERIGNWTVTLSDDVNTRIVEAMGRHVAFQTSAIVVLESIGKQMLSIEEELCELGGRSRGRPQNRAAKEVAALLAKFYVEVTGKRPTFTEDRDGLHGYYTPALRSVFDALGWEKVDLRGPASFAISQITEEYLAEATRPAIMALGIGFPTGATR